MPRIQVFRMLSFPRPLSVVISATAQTSSWAKQHKGGDWDEGNVKKLGPGVETVKASLIARSPTLDDRTRALEMAPTLSKYYRQTYSELESGS